MQQQKKKKKKKKKKNQKSKIGNAQMYRDFRIYHISIFVSENMVNLSDLFGGKVKVDVDQGKRSLDDEILDEYMDQEWRQEFLASEVG